VTACDILKDGANFCAEVFGARPVYSCQEPAAIPLQDSFDLIWCGSLLTHLNAEKWGQFLSFFAGRLSPGGVLLFTTHGRYVRDRLDRGEYDYGLTRETVKDLVGVYDSDGFAYEDYPGQKEYGLSISSTPWVCTQLQVRPDLRLVTFTERGWDNHQDVIACVRC
jgi:SAM-dependent methyltransferase